MPPLPLPLPLDLPLPRASSGWGSGTLAGRTWHEQSFVRALAGLACSCAASASRLSCSRRRRRPPPASRRRAPAHELVRRPVAQLALRSQYHACAAGAAAVAGLGALGGVAVVELAVEHADDVGVTVCLGDRERGRAGGGGSDRACGGDAGIGSEGEEGGDSGRVLKHRRDEQRRGAFLVRRVDVGAELRENLHGLQIRQADAAYTGCSRLPRRVDVGAELCKSFTVGVPPGRPWTQAWRRPCSASRCWRRAARSFTVSVWPCEEMNIGVAPPCSGLDGRRAAREPNVCVTLEMRWQGAAPSLFGVSMLAPSCASVLTVSV